MKTQIKRANNAIKAGLPDDGPERDEYIACIREYLHSLSRHSDMPVNNVQWVPVEMVQANDYNPNSVARREMRLLHTSIMNDKYTQPIVTIRDPDTGKYVVVDGFHRYITCRENADIREMTHGCVPVVVLDKPINDRMASTVRHNRARGKHSVAGMSSIVFSMLENGWTDEQVCAEMGMEADELVRLKHVTGFSKLFEDVEYRRAWETKKMLRMKRDWKDDDEG